MKTNVENVEEWLQEFQSYSQDATEARNNGDREWAKRSYEVAAEYRKKIIALVTQLDAELESLQSD